MFHGEWSGTGSNTLLSLVPVAPLNVNQDVTAWRKLMGNAKVSTGVVAPDGSLTAARLTSFSAVQSKRVFSEQVNVNVGDWFIAGGWIKSENAQKEPFNESVLGFSESGFKFEQNNSSVFLPMLSDACSK